jgi:hypothetical protein
MIVAQGDRPWATIISPLAGLEMQPLLTTNSR